MSTGGSVVSGTVRGPDGEPVVEARVFFASTPVPTPDVAQLTDERGRFTLFAPAPGRYELMCHSEPFAPGAIDVEVPPSGDPIEIEISLE